MQARSVGANVSVQRSDDPGQGAAGPTAPVGAIVRVAGIDLPDGPGLEARLAQIAADGGRSAVHSVYQALDDEVAAIDAEHTSAEAFAEEAANVPHRRVGRAMVARDVRRGSRAAGDGRPDA